MSPGVLMSLPRVERRQVAGAQGAIDPPLRPNASEEERLAWAAAVTAFDSGLFVRLWMLDTGHEWVVEVEGETTQPMSLPVAHGFLSGVKAGGVWAARRAAQTALRNAAEKARRCRDEAGAARLHALANDLDRKVPGA